MHFIPYEIFAKLLKFETRQCLYPCLLVCRLRPHCISFFIYLFILAAKECVVSSSSLILNTSTHTNWNSLHFRKMLFQCSVKAITKKLHTSVTAHQRRALKLYLLRIEYSNKNMQTHLILKDYLGLVGYLMTQLETGLS